MMGNPIERALFNWRSSDGNPLWNIDRFNQDHQGEYRLSAEELIYQEELDE